MGIKTTDTTKVDERREKLKVLREFQQPLLDAIGESESYYIPKMAYRPIGKSEIHISFFYSELKKGTDIFTEFASRDLIPEDAQRRLYKWKFNPYFEEEYDKTEVIEKADGKMVDQRYLVPVSELILIKAPEKKEPVVQATKQENMEFDLMDPNSDAPLDQLTVRDIAALLLKKPVSNKEWLNKLIN